MRPDAPVDPLTGMSAARFGVYVHFPYCLSKCPYCDFASTVVREIPEERYTRALLAELALRLAARPDLEGRRLDSVFIGGGTPSLWAPERVGRVLRALSERFDLPAGAEVTLEANPGAADAARFQGFRQAGVNRLSIGVQSFEEAQLRFLGRAHDAVMAEAAFAAAREAGFLNLSLDLIYGVPGQTLASAGRDVARALALLPDHLSLYALTLDRQSLAEEVPLSRQLARGELQLPPDDLVVQMGHAIGRACAEAGLVRYEISNYAKAGLHSRHNTLYWTGGEYLALGTGATGCVQGEGGPRRYANLRSAGQYLGAVEAGRLPEASSEALSRTDLFAERLAMGLRLSTGVDLAAVCEAFGEPLGGRQAKVDRLVSAGLARISGGRLALTPRGADLHSAVAAELL